jgi:uncharacterized protein (DUF58 family)
VRIALPGLRRRAPAIGPVLPEEETEPTALRSLWTRLAPLLRPPRRLRITIQGWIFLALVFAVAGAALNTGNNLLYMLCSIMLAMIAVSGVLSESALRRVELDVDLPSALYAGREARGQLRARNPRRWLPNVALVVRHVGTARCDGGSEPAGVPLVPAGETAHHGIAYRFRRRGLHRLAGFEVGTTYPFGLFRKSYRVAAPRDVLVFPALGRAGDASRSAGHASGAQEGRRRGVDGDFQGLREFLDGEDARLIHWKSSARRGALMAVERDRAEGATCTIHLLPGGDPSEGEAFARRFEVAVSRAATTAHELLEAGHRVGLVTPDGAVAAQRGDAQLRRILTHLALIRIPVAALTPALARLRAQLGGRDVGLR